jgi:hypothetical protein
MNLSKILKFRDSKKSTQVKNEYGYRMLTYNGEGVEEVIWNRTNLKPPERIVDKSLTKEMKLSKISQEPVLYYSLKEGERYFTYKTQKDYEREKLPLLVSFWNNNLFNCSRIYSSFDEFYKHSIKKLTRKKIHLRTNGID